MRVLAFTTVFPNLARPQQGLFVFERLRNCARLAEVRVVAPRPAFPWPAMQAVPRHTTLGGMAVAHPTFRYVPRYGKFLDGAFLYASALGTVRRIRRDFDFDLIDAHFGYPDGFAAVLLGRSMKRPVAITLRGTEPLVAAADPRRRRALAWALSNADRLIAVAQPLAECADALIREFAPVGRPPRKAPPRIEVIANGVDTARFAPGPQAAAREALGLPAEGRLLASVGHLSPRKGFQRVLRVLPEVLAAAPDLRFAVIGGKGGEADNGPDLKRQAAELGLTERVIFAGSQPPDSIAQWLQAADAFVLASDHEGCPNVVWEAMATGLPVVATRVGEVPAMVPPATGIVIDQAEDAPALRDALVAVLAGGHDRAAIRAWAEQHTWAGVADRVVAQWASMIEAAPAQAWAAPVTRGISA
jgi:glycosyltransferase involved in cell wall biosynthesis